MTTQQQRENDCVHTQSCHNDRPLVQGYLAALSASSYSYVSMLQHFGPIMNAGSAAISLTYLASEKIIPGTPPSTH